MSGGRYSSNTKLGVDLDVHLDEILNFFNTTNGTATLTDIEGNSVTVTSWSGLLASQGAGAISYATLAELTADNSKPLGTIAIAGDTGYSYRFNGAGQGWSQLPNPALDAAISAESLASSGLAIAQDAKSIASQAASGYIPSYTALASSVHATQDQLAGVLSSISPVSSGATLFDGRIMAASSAVIGAVLNTAGIITLSATNGSSASLWQIPYINIFGVVTLGDIVKTATGVDPITSAASTSNGITITLTPGSNLNWGSERTVLPTTPASTGTVVVPLNSNTSGTAVVVATDGTNCSMWQVPFINIFGTISLGAINRTANGTDPILSIVSTGAGISITTASGVSVSSSLLTVPLSI